MEQTDPWVLHLYVRGWSPQSEAAIRLVRRLRDERLAGRCELEVIDVHQQPELAHRGGVLATPTLVRAAPGPVRRVVGQLTEARICEALDLPDERAGSPEP
jgi:hypothetical protein